MSQTTDKSGQHYAEYGMPDSPARKDWDDLRYMEKSNRKLLDKGQQSLRITAQEETKRVTKKPTSKKPTKKISTKK